METDDSLKKIVKTILPILIVALVVAVVLVEGRLSLSDIVYTVLFFVAMIFGTYILVEWKKITGHRSL